MDKLTAIKIKYDDGHYSDEIPVSALAENVEWDETHTLVDVLGDVALDTKGSVQDQLTQLFNSKVTQSDMQIYVANKVNTWVADWLKTNVNPTGSMVAVDASLSITGAGADAKKTGDELIALNNLTLLTEKRLTPFPLTEEHSEWEYMNIYNDQVDRVKYRVATPYFYTDRPIRIEVLDPLKYRFYVLIYDTYTDNPAERVFQTPWVGEYHIDAHKIIRVVIAYGLPYEDTKAVLNMDLMRSTFGYIYRDEMLAPTIRKNLLQISALKYFSKSEVVPYWLPWRNGTWFGQQEQWQSKYRYRICTDDYVTCDYDVTFKSYNGYNIKYSYYHLESMNSPWVTELTIPKNTPFRLSIANFTKEQPSHQWVADLYEFLSNVTMEIPSDRFNELVNLELTHFNSLSTEIYYNQSKQIRLPFQRGTIPNSTVNFNPNNTYRMSTPTAQINENDLVVMLTDLDYRFYIQYTPDYSAGWYYEIHKPVYIPKNTKFMISISRWPQDISAVLSTTEQQRMVNSLRVMTLQEYETKQGSIINNNKDKELLLLNFTQSNSTNIVSNGNPLVFIHFSDVHYRKGPWKRLCQYYNNYQVYIKFALHTGDYACADLNQSRDLYSEVPETKQCCILNCVGNHDTYRKMTPQQLATEAETYNLLFKHTQNWGAVFDNTVENCMYYYKDFDNNKIRLIVLDQYHQKEKQIEWFVKVLNGAKEKQYSVITAAHEPLNIISQPIECTFTSIAGFQDDHTPSSAYGYDEQVQQFVDDGGDFIAHFAGHWHHDYIGYTANNLLQVVVESATWAHAEWDESKRMFGNRGYDAFNVVSVDKATHQLRLLRIGNNSDYFGRNKNVLVYDYQQKKIITNY